MVKEMVQNEVTIKSKFSVTKYSQKLIQTEKKHTVSHHFLDGAAGKKEGVGKPGPKSTHE